MALAISSYLSTHSPSMTVWIPAFLGVPLIILGGLADKGIQRKHLMHVAVVLSLLALLGSFSGLMKLPALIAGQEVDRPVAVMARSIMAILSAIYLLFAIRSFVLARKT
ncbi:MAG: hypothetical protein DCC75_13900 [Proteobacteria bacterium]|nr:MAG: hypothetical protein DCC75_13900 [Pseudomonadota bacterium]